MPEYLAPGVYVEETSFRSKSIEGVSTTTTGFVGPCRYGPVVEPADVITSLGEFERSYAGGGQLWFAAEGAPADVAESDNYLWHAVRAFFSEGGKRLYIARTFRPLEGEYPPDFTVLPVDRGPAGQPLYADGHARQEFGGLILRSRFPGAASDLIVALTVTAGQNILAAELLSKSEQGSPGPLYRAKLGALADRDVVLLHRQGSPDGTDELFVAEYDPTAPEEERWKFRDVNNALVSLPELGLVIDPTPKLGDSLYVLTLSVSVLSSDRRHDLGTWTGLPFDPAHERGGRRDSLFEAFRSDPASIAEARTIPLVMGKPASGDDGLDILSALFPDLLTLSAADRSAGLTLPKKLAAGILQETTLEGGNDGLRPGASEYEGTDDETNVFKTGLKQFEDIEDISIVAAPGSTADYTDSLARDNANAVYGLLIAHAQRMRYRIAVLDCPPEQGLADVRHIRAKLDSTYAAFYYPWVRVLDPVTRRELDLPPSGFVAGIYARNDINRAVYKAPANEVVNLAIGFETTLNKAQQEVLNPEGINCFRFFEGRGYRLWGARTCSSDPEWKYVNLRRYFAYLERSIDKGTQWAVFEPNGYQLWGNVRRTIEDFLLNEFQSGALLGEKPEQAYFVRCDRSTMNQNDLDNGRLVCLIGVAALKPAEFVIFRIGQWTGDRKP